MESWIAVNLYLSKKASLSAWLHNTFPNITTTEIDLFYNAFIIAHPLEALPSDKYEIPFIATENSCCKMELGIFKEPVTLTLEQEVELLYIIETNYDKGTKIARLKNWFLKFCNEYGYQAKLKRDRQIQTFELANSFCLYHGFDIYNLDRRKRQQLIEPTSEITNKQLFINIVFYCMSIFFYAAAVAFCFKVGDCLMSNGWFFVGGTLIAIGFLIIALPLSKIFNK